MTTLFFVGVHVIGVIGLIVGGMALSRNRRDAKSTGLSSLAWHVALLVGAVLAVFSFFVSYPLDAEHRILGFPFMAAAWKKHGNHWEDFLGPLTLPAYAANAAFALLVPQLFLRVRNWKMRRRRSPSPALVRAKR